MTEHILVRPFIFKKFYFLCQLPFFSSKPCFPSSIFLHISSGTQSIWLVHFKEAICNNCRINWISCTCSLKLRLQGGKKNSVPLSLLHFLIHLSEIGHGSDSNHHLIRAQTAVCHLVLHGIELFCSQLCKAKEKRSTVLSAVLCLNVFSEQSFMNLFIFWVNVSWKYCISALWRLLSMYSFWCSLAIQESAIFP